MRLKTVIALGFSLLVIMSVLVVSANAVQNRSNDVYVSLNFSNNTAACKCEISADSSNDWISATMELWRGNTLLNSWSSSGTDCISMDETENVVRYRTYRLVINYTVNGIAQQSVESSRYYG